jgi:hypothetical protein
MTRRICGAVAAAKAVLMCSSVLVASLTDSDLYSRKKTTREFTGLRGHGVTGSRGYGVTATVVLSKRPRKAFELQHDLGMPEFQVPQELRDVISLAGS